MNANTYTKPADFEAFGSLPVIEATAVEVQYSNLPPPPPQVIRPRPQTPDYNVQWFLRMAAVSFVVLSVLLGIIGGYKALFFP